MKARFGGARAAGACVLAVLGLASAAAADSFRLEELGEGPVLVPGLGNAELSGITWAGGSRFLAVDDDGGRLCPLELGLDEAQRAIASVAAGPCVVLAGARDAEGVAFRAGSVLVSDESVAAIREYDPATGKLRHSVIAPQVFRGRMTKNRGFESITVAPDGQGIWIANEGPLTVDGDLVRLQRLDAELAPTGAWAYRSERVLGFAGVVDLLALEGGDLLVLERTLTGGGFSARIFQADFADATNVTRAPALRELDGVRPVGKRRLWERTGGFQNFEGMALGPELAGGGRLVVLVSDGGERRPPMLLALRLVAEANGAPER
jgi:hypothetical protein